MKFGKNIFEKSKKWASFTHFIQLKCAENLTLSFSINMLLSTTFQLALLEISCRVMVDISLSPQSPLILSGYSSLPSSKETVIRSSLDSLFSLLFVSSNVYSDVLFFRLLLFLLRPISSPFRTEAPFKFRHSILVSFSNSSTAPSLAILSCFWPLSLLIHLHSLSSILLR